MDSATTITLVLKSWLNSYCESHVLLSSGETKENKEACMYSILKELIVR